MLLEYHFTLCSNDLCLISFVTSWKLFRSHAVTPRWLDFCKECIQSGWSKQCDCHSLAHEIPAKDAAGRFESCISRKIICRLALVFLMDLRLNGTRKSISLSVYLMFDLEAGRFKFLGENLLGDRKWHFHPCLLGSNSQSKAHKRSCDIVFMKMTTLFPESLFTWTSVWKTRALGATILK